jgi:predicted permease
LLDRKGDHWLYIMGRLKSSSQAAAVESKVNVQLHQWLMENDPPQSDSDTRAVARVHLAVVPAGGGIASMKENYGRDLRLLSAITGLVLLIACGNLANLLLARGTASAAQTSIRVALGASRARLVRQTLIEAVLLAAIGGVVGLLVATEMAEFLIRLAFRGATYVPIEAAPSLPVLGFAFLLSLLTGVIFGIAPAWLASRADPANALRGAGRSTRKFGTLPQRSMVVMQAAVAVVLLAGAGLMIETLRNLMDQRFGYESEGRAVVNVNAGFGGYAPERFAEIYRQVELRMKQIPGVRDASLSLYSPMEGNNWQSGIRTEDHPEQNYSPSWDRVSPSFFKTIGSHVLRGRMFDERDTPDSTHVTVVNQAFVDKVFPNEDPMGKRFGLEHPADYEIVGVVENVRFRNPRQPAPPMFFLPLLQMSRSEWAITGLARSNIIGNIELHVAGPPPDFGLRVRRTLAEIDPNLTMLDLTSIDEQLGNLLRHELLIARLAELFGALALVLASVGLYGVTAYSVARRTSEIGIRGALGATRGDILRMILRGALGETGLGLLIGIPAALGAGRMLADQLYGVKTYDPWILGGAALILAACACAAGLGPALRASSIDPVQALRVE